MVREFPTFCSERKKRNTSGRSTIIFERIFRNITVPFDFQLKFPDFLAKWYPRGGTVARALVSGLT